MMEQALRGQAQRPEKVRVLAVPAEKAGGQVKAEMWARGKAKVRAGDRAKVPAKAEVPVGIKVNPPAFVKDRAVAPGIAL